ncbi:MAG: hypothetical protein ACR2PL_24790 [Dehalococcoidia bacterium]
MAEFFVDHNVTPDLAAVLIEHGQDTVTAFEIRRHRLSDAEIRILHLINSGAPLANECYQWTTRVGWQQIV